MAWALAGVKINVQRLMVVIKIAVDVLDSWVWVGFWDLWFAQFWYDGWVFGLGFRGLGLWFRVWGFGV